MKRKKEKWVFSPKNKKSAIMRIFLIIALFCGNDNRRVEDAGSLI